MNGELITSAQQFEYIMECMLLLAKNVLNVLIIPIRKHLVRRIHRKCRENRK